MMMLFINPGAPPKAATGEKGTEPVPIGMTALRPRGCGRVAK